MRFSAWQCLPLFLALLSPCAMAKAAPVPDYDAQLQAVRDRVDHAPSAADLAALEQLIADGRFAALAPRVQAVTLAVAGWGALGLEQVDRARALLARASEINPTEPMAWYLRAVADHQGGEPDLAARHLARHIALAPKAAQELDAGVIFAFLNDADEAGEGKRVLLQSLFDAQWKVGGSEPPDAWYMLAVLQFEAGERDAVPATLARLRNADGIVRVRADRRFDPWVDRAAPRWDIRRATQEEQDVLRTANLLQPDDLSVLVSLSSTMLALAQYDEVLRMSSQVEDMIAAAKDQGAEGPYQPMDELAWLLENRVSALQRLGRADDAVALRQRLRQMPEAGGANVSQALNLGEMMVGLARPQEALQAIAQVGEASPYGEMVRRHVQLLVARQLHDDQQADLALTYLREHRADAPSVWLDCLLLLGRVDEAAAFVGEALASPVRRGDMLFALQVRPDPAPLPAFAAREPRMQQLRERQDVRAAVEAVGRIEHYNLPF